MLASHASIFMYKLVISNDFKFSRCTDYLYLQCCTVWKNFVLFLILLKKAVKYACRNRMVNFCDT